MGTIAEKLIYLNDTKTAIKEAIIAKGVEVSDTDSFRSYSDKISEISTSASGVPLEDIEVTVLNYTGGNPNLSVVANQAYDYAIYRECLAGQTITFGINPIPSDATISNVLCKETVYKLGNFSGTTYSTRTFGTSCILIAVTDFQGNVVIKTIHHHVMAD